jgi:hypothetical protein
MSAECLEDLERDVELGNEVFACPQDGRNHWSFHRDQDALCKKARDVARARGVKVSVLRLIPTSDVVPGDCYLVPRTICGRDIPVLSQIEWALVESREAAELLRAVRNGPAPYFGARVEYTASPA